MNWIEVVAKRDKEIADLQWEVDALKNAIVAYFGDGTPHQKAMADAIFKGVVKERTRGQG